MGLHLESQGQLVAALGREEMSRLAGGDGCGYLPTGAANAALLPQDIYGI
jgi:hypothetical protein